MGKPSKASMYFNLMALALYVIVTVIMKFVLGSHFVLWPWLMWVCWWILALAVTGYRYLRELGRWERHEEYVKTITKHWEEWEKEYENTN